MFSQPRTSFVKVPATGKRQKKTVKENGCRPKEKADAEVPKPTRRKKLDAYKRLLAGAFPDQTHDLKNVPDTPKEASVKTFREKKMKIEEGEVPCSQMTIPLEVVPVPQEQVPALTEPPVLYEEVTTTVATSASQAVLASWSKIVAQANHNMKKKNESVCSTATAETSEELWCVVHGRSFTESTHGWVQLQLHGGQVWVPDKKGKSDCPLPASSLQLPTPTPGGQPSVPQMYSQEQGLKYESPGLKGGSRVWLSAVITHSCGVVHGTTVKTETDGNPHLCP
ncbi:developmental pluripotency associated 4 [Cricetulus griseus]